MTATSELPKQLNLAALYFFLGGFVELKQALGCKRNYFSFLQRLLECVSCTAGS
jgi:hypothetical protein